MKLAAGDMATVIMEPGVVPQAVPGGGLPRFNDFQVLELIGEGGMGVVYKAREIRLNRIVALKMLGGNRSTSSAMKQRFLIEARAMAKLRHPGIVAVYQVGENDGRPYFAMEFVEGRTLGDLVAERPLKSWRAIHYMIEIAEAVQFAHDNDVLHRDLKPSNILLDNFDKTRVTDFGLAKEMSEDSGLTISGEVMGTPSYMPPEQAMGQTALLGTRSDVYSLGAVLYHLLTGRAPFGPGPLHEVIRQVLDEEPAPPRTLNKEVPPEVETICLKCLKKNPEHRYASAEAFAEDLRRYTRGDEIFARPDTRLQKVARFAWKKRVPIASCALALTVGTAVWLLRPEDVQARETLRAERLARVQSEFEAGNSAEAVALLAAEVRNNPDDAHSAERLLSALTHRSFAVLAAPALELPGEIARFDLSPDSQHAVTYGPDGMVRIINLSAGEVQAEVSVPGVNVLRFALDGRSVFAAAGNEIREIGLGAEEFQLSYAHDSEVLGLDLKGDLIAAYSRDGQGCLWRRGEPDAGRILPIPEVSSVSFSTADDRVFVSTWTDIMVALFTDDLTPSAQIQFPGTVEQTISSPDGNYLAGIGGTDAFILSTLTGRPGIRLTNSVHLGSLVFSPNGTRLLSCLQNAPATIWDLAAGAPAVQLSSPAPLAHGAFSPDGSKVAAAGNDRNVRVWNALSGALAVEPVQHPAEIVGLEFARGADRVVTATRDGRLRIWDVRPRAARMPVFVSDVELDSVRFADGGNSLTVTTIPNPVPAISTWYFRTGEAKDVEVTDNTLIFPPQVTRDGQWVLEADDQWKQIFAVSIKDRTPRFEPIRLDNPFTEADWSEDERFIITLGEDWTVRAWDSVTGKSMGPAIRIGARPTFADITPGTSRLIVGAENGAVQVFDLFSGEPLSERFIGYSDVPSHPDLRDYPEITSACESPDGRWLATSALDGRAHLFATPRPVGTAPAWLPDLAERLVGLKQSTNQVIPVDMWDLETARQHAVTTSESGGDDWLSWLLGDTATRPHSPGAFLVAGE